MTVIPIHGTGCQIEIADGLVSDKIRVTLTKADRDLFLYLNSSELLALHRAVLVALPLFHFVDESAGAYDKVGASEDTSWEAELD